MDNTQIKQFIEDGHLTVGIEFGSTRIKAIAIDDQCQTLATGSFEWENSYRNGYWTYSMNDAWVGIQKAYGAMTQELKDKYDGTWRNNNANKANEILREDFQVNIPER